MLRKYNLGFEWRGLVLFLAVMVPNFIWFAIPAPNDILRADSLTPEINSIATVFQIAFVVCLCLLMRVDQNPFCLNRTTKCTVASVLLYYVCWALYYQGVTGAAVILGLTLFPCIAFLLFAVDRRNTVAMMLIVLFTACHLAHTFKHFIA
jgi:hypothetical protein